MAQWSVLMTTDSHSHVDVLDMFTFSLVDTDFISFCLFAGFGGAPGQS